MSFRKITVKSGDEEFTLEVTEEEYQKYYRPWWQQKKHEQRNREAMEQNGYTEESYEAWRDNASEGVGIPDMELPGVDELVEKKLLLGVLADAMDSLLPEERELAMYWPSTSADGEFIFRDIEGEPLNPDEVLSRYKDWRDSSEWPVSSRQQNIVQREMRKQADPLTKDGVIGAFCRTYSIEEAISNFLPDVYQPSAMPGRYDYIPADSQAGVVIYEGKFAYSHHATDPACGRLMNAFDMVRIHKFSHLDARVSEDEEPAKLPSFKAMGEFAVSDENVKVTLAGERAQSAREEFAAEDDWQKLLEFDRKGTVKDTLNNLVLVMRHDRGMQPIAFNLHRDGIDAGEGLPWKQIKPGWNDSDFASLKVYLNKGYGVYAPTKTKDALLAVASERAYHPVREYLDALPEWDGTERIDTLLTDYLGAEDSGYTRAVMRKTLAAAVARIYQPGVKFDSVLILNGPQGIGKSTLFARLAGAWFSDSLTLTDMADGAVYDENGNVKHIHDRKLEALEDLVEAANGKPVLIAYWYKHDLERLKKHTGAVELDTAEDMQKWNAGEIPVAAIHPASAGHGLNLQAGGSTLVWFGLTWSLELYQQMNARLWRQGQEETVVIHHLIAKGTLDERVMAALEKKDCGQSALVDAVKARIGGGE